VAGARGAMPAREVEPPKVDQAAPAVAGALAVGAGAVAAGESPLPSLPHPHPIGATARSAKSAIRSGGRPTRGTLADARPSRRTVDVPPRRVGREPDGRPREERERRHEHDGGRHVDGGTAQLGEDDHGGGAHAASRYEAPGPAHPAPLLTVRRMTTRIAPAANETAMSGRQR
jgi:hypothetical protein